MPNNPPAAPFFAQRTFRKNPSESSRNAAVAWWSLTLCGKGSRGRGGCRSGFVRARNVAKLPGAKQDPSNACLAEDNSPNWANAWARSALSSTESARAWRMRRLPRHSPTSWLKRNKCNQGPWAKRESPLELLVGDLASSCATIQQQARDQEEQLPTSDTPNLVELGTATFNFLESQPQTRTECAFQESRWALEHTCPLRKRVNQIHSIESAERHTRDCGCQDLFETTCHLSQDGVFHVSHVRMAINIRLITSPN